ncbi:MAG TPA: carboxypeptidase-like regulatory domain-containing protein [Terriglobales bacterium]|nr:carboxypeptidase-like regulatory domain-containing protein [Terriglobales bacterium]
MAAIAISVPLWGQVAPSPNPATAQITGTVTDTSGDVVSGATVVLRHSSGKDVIKLVSDDNGFFDFTQLHPGTYRVAVSAPDFADWTSADLVLSPGQYMLISDCKLRVQVTTTINVGDRPDEIATEQLQVEEKQRVFGVIPNFYVVYDPDPAPLTTRLKFRLAMKTSTDIVSILGIGALAGINQAGNTPDYRQGLKGYGERFGAAAGDGFSDIMIGGAILPSILRQDPRYYYRGTGTNRSRILHAITSPFVCKGDNGKSQPNYSSMGGDLSSSALSNLYYPPSNRGAGLVFQNFFVMTGERTLSSLVQEFVIGRITARQRLRN